jgi:soluble lytic murein transglycosylase-like protein
VTVAAALVAADLALHRGLVRWNGSGKLPPAVVRAELREQLLEVRLAHDPALKRRVLAQLPRRLARDVRDELTALHELAPLTPARPRSTFRIASAEPSTRLRAWYAEAERRTNVPWAVLAAVNYVESDFGRLREASVAGAQGPMQFIPSTWATYGRGDVHDPHAAILAAARLLRAAGAPADVGAALHAYNPSWAYVDAVERYASRIERDPVGFLALYGRRLLVRTPGGYQRLT